jgi:hypothetical protein
VNMPVKHQEGGEVLYPLARTVPSEGQHTTVVDIKDLWIDFNFVMMSKKQSKYFPLHPNANYDEVALEALARNYEGLTVENANGVLIQKFMFPIITIDRQNPEIPTQHRMVVWGYEQYAVAKYFMTHQDQSGAKWQQIEILPRPDIPDYDVRLQLLNQHVSADVPSAQDICWQVLCAMSDYKAGKRSSDSPPITEEFVESVLSRSGYKPNTWKKLKRTFDRLPDNPYIQQKRISMRAVITVAQKLSNYEDEMNDLIKESAENNWVTSKIEEEAQKRLDALTEKPEPTPATQIVAGTATVSYETVEMQRMGQALDALGVIIDFLYEVSPLSREETTKAIQFQEALRASIRAEYSK